MIYKETLRSLHSNHHFLFQSLVYHALGFNMPDLNRDQVMPIAVVGIGGRFPGDASNPDRLWEILLKGESTLSKTPKDRFNVDAFYHPQAERQGTQNFHEGHFMNRPIDAFDAPFFSITPAEARAMDPQQRMCLEVAYEAMENAGIRLNRASASSTSCYVGCFNHDYMNLLNRDPENLPFYSATGTEASCLSNRVSWFFNLAGPSMTVDTACSSSLIALHLACQSLRTGESEMSLVGGANIMSSMEMNMQLSNLQMISPDGKSQTFDEKANGYGRGEGICFVVIKSLDKALRDSDVIRAVILNTGSNQDGHTPGLTLPSRNMQKCLIRKVYEEAGLRMEETGYFEAHARTAAGDSTETRALGETIGKSRSAGEPLWIGSIKSNIGHLEGGSGLAALIKTVYVLEQGVIPPQIWFDKLNPRISLEEWNLAVPTQVTPWPCSGPRRASVNSFGFAGANAHIILEDARSYLARRNICGRSSSTGSLAISPVPSQTSNDSGFGPERDKETPTKPFPQLLVWSAHEQPGLKRVYESWSQYLESKAGTLSLLDRKRLLTDLSYTAAERRTRFPWRSFTVCSMPEGIINGASRIPPPVRSSQSPRVAFVFTGQGAQHHAMGRSLMKYEVYSTSMNAADAHLKSLGCSWSLLEELSHDAESSRVGSAEFSQPLCTALQVALVDLLQSLGVWPPEVVIGHSGGETAAAYAKGALTRESAWTVAYHRGRVCTMVPELDPELEGDMLAAGISENQALEYINHLNSGELVVACVNSPSSVTLSGDVPAIVEAEKMIKADGHLAKRLGVNRAYHSSHMKAVSKLYRHLLKDIYPLPESSGGPKMFSCVTGTLINNCDLGGNYWVTNLLSQVKFTQALGGLISHSKSGRVNHRKGYCYVSLMLEIGPHGAMQGPIKQNLKATGAKCTSVSVLDRKEDAAHSLLEAIGVLFQHGYDGDIAAANRPGADISPRLLVDLPPFPWNHSNRYWHESALVSDYRFRKFPRKDLLGVRDNDNNEYQLRWRHFLRLSENPWIEDHQVENNIIYPAAGMVAMAIEACRETSEVDKIADTYELRDVRIKTAIMVPRGEEGVETSIQLHASSDSWQRFSIYSRVGRSPWSLNCSGLLRINYKTDGRPAGFLNEDEIATAVYKAEYERAGPICTESLSTHDFYEQQSALGFQFGEWFQNVQGIRKCPDQMVFAVRTPNIANSMPRCFTHDHLIHPCTLDSLIHASLALLNNDRANGPAVPISIERILVSAGISSDPGTVFRAHSTARPDGLRDSKITVRALTGERDRLAVLLEHVKVVRLGDSPGIQDLKSGLTKIASKMHWDVDVSHLSPLPFPTNSIVSIKATTSLGRLFQLLGHKYPDLNILQVGAGKGQITEHIVESIKGANGESTPWFWLYTAIDSPGFLETFHKRFQSWGPYFKTISIIPDRPWEEQGLSANSYDCILFNADSQVTADNAIRNAKACLKYHGTLIILQRDISDDSLALWTEKLQSQQFTDPNYQPSKWSYIYGGPWGPIMGFGVRTEYATLHETQTMDLKGKHCVVASDLACPVLFDIVPEAFLLVKRLLLESKSVLWLTSGATMECSNPKSALVSGLFRVIWQEHPDISLTTLDLESCGDIQENVAIIMELLRAETSAQIDREFTIRDGHLMIPRILPDQGLNDLTSTLRGGPRIEPEPLKQKGRALTLDLGTPGDFDSIYFRDDLNYEGPLSSHTVEIEVKAAGLNATDVMSVLDKMMNPALGLECSGIVSRVGPKVKKYKPGDRVFTWCPGSFANFVRSPECMVQRMHIGMTFQTAAALPVSYCTAYQALVECARLQTGDRVLIHAAAGGVGQAAIMIAKNLGAEVYATVSSEEKKFHLMETYDLPQHHILYSRDLSFFQGILRITEGKGVNIVLNSLSGEGLRLSFMSVAPFGKFIHIGQKDIGERNLDMTPFTKNISFHSVNILELYQTSLSLAAKLFGSAMEFYYEFHCQPAGPLHVLNFSEIPHGLRLLRGGKQIGKVVLKAGDADMVMAIPPPIKTAQFRSNATYIVVGGFGGLGEYIAKWMVEHGAQHLVLLSRRGADHPDARKVLQNLAAAGANVQAFKCDISDIESVKKVMKQWELEGSRPVRGIIQAAMTLADATFRQMTPKQWTMSTNTKALGTWNLHCTSPRDLDFFVMLSSVSGIIGWRGQGNYAAGNTFLDALAHHRRAQGLPAVSIDVGAIFNVGYVAQNANMKESMRSLGLVGLAGDELIWIIQVAIAGHNSTAAQVILGLATGGYLASNGLEEPYWFSNSKVSHLRQIGATEQGTDIIGPGLSEQLNNAPSMASAAEIVLNTLQARLAKQMMVDLEDVDASRPVSSYGVDSLTAVDIRAWSLKDAQADISILDIVNTASIGSLAQVIVKNSRLLASRKLEDDVVK
ncbi:unnamed protein product [Penicillium egyptiacum]|uniref:Carrier domain-containing protein n=1 Tax=Penicillium egyptiacum TaxID=1303716 RepID=A0A9W4P6U1_9EURO|nr:unnamed protein product [Penicillium egyptiacum]